MYAIIPLGMLAKPLGAFVFGRLGDRIGRTKVLSITLMGMAVKTALMGFLPTYQQIGIFAPVLLACTRILFNFFSAGETTGGALYLLEKDKPTQRNVTSSLFDASGIFGILLASWAVWLTHPYDGFWRLLFWVGAFIGVMGWFLRRQPEEEAYKPSPESSSWKVLWEHRRPLFMIASVSGFSYANYYLVTTFMNGFLPLISSITKAEVLSLNSLLLTMDMLLLPLFGILSVRVNREQLMLLAIALIITSCMPLLLLLQKTTLFLAVFVRMTLTILGTCLAAPYHAWAFEVSPSKHRYLIGALGTTLGSQLFGAPFPAVSLWLYNQTGWIFAPAFPLIFVGLLALIALKKSSVEKKPQLLHN